MVFKSCSMKQYLMAFSKMPVDVKCIKFYCISSVDVTIRTYYSINEALARGDMLDWVTYIAKYNTDTKVLSFKYDIRGIN